MRFEELVKYLGRLIGEPGLKPDNDGKVVLSLDENTVLTLQEFTEFDIYLAYCEIGDIPNEGRESFYEKVLGANLMYKGTGGACLALNEQTKRLILTQYWPLAVIDEEWFERTINHFLTNVRNWQVVLKEYREKGPQAEPAIPDDTLHAPNDHFTGMLYI